MSCDKCMSHANGSSFVLCNEGYTIERYIHGWEAGYNDIQPWDYKGIPSVFGAGSQYKGYQIKTRAELTDLFADEKFCSAPYLQVCKEPSFAL